MRAVVQRVETASVRVDGEVVGEIGHGLLILLGIAPDDGATQLDWLVNKLITLRIFDDEGGRMNCSLLEAGGSALVVSQFTLYADTRGGRRPSFVGAAPPQVALPLYERFCEALAARGVPVARGRFGAKMSVSLVNQGPVTLILDTPT